MSKFSHLAFSLAGIAALASDPASATVLSLGEFNNPGDLEGFSGNNTSSLTVGTDGFLTGDATNSDPQLSGNGNGLAPAAGETFSTLEFRVRELDSDGGVVTSFDQGGLIFISGVQIANANPALGLPGFTAVDSGDGFFTVSADISALGSDPISGFRLDPVGNTPSGNTFQVDFIRVNTVPEPGSLALLGLGGAALLRRNRKA